MSWRCRAIRAANALKGQKLTFRLLRPDGIEAKRFVDVADTGGGYSVDVDLPSSARTGPWTLEAYLDPEGDPLSPVRSSWSRTSSRRGSRRS